MSPAVSVLLPVYNAAPYLEAALRSLSAQTFTDFEIIAIDDGSTDASASILAAFAAREPRLRVYSQPNQGIIAALNRAASLASAPLLARMDADDISYPNRFARQVEFLAAHPKVAVVGAATRSIDSNGRPISAYTYPASHANIQAVLKYQSCLAHPAVMLRAETLQAVGGYRPAFVHAEDYDLWLRISEIAELSNLPEVLLEYRVHSAGVSHQNVQAQALATLAAKASAAARRAGHSDPFIAGQPVSIETLRQIGVSEAAIQQELAVKFWNWAGWLAQINQLEASAESIRAARACTRRIKAADDLTLFQPTGRLLRSRVYLMKLALTRPALLRALIFPLP